MRRGALLLGCLLACSLYHTVQLSCSRTELPDTVTVATFNIQKLGKTKVAKEHVMATLEKIFDRYDIVLVQEVQDISQRAPYLLNQTINSCCRSSCKSFHYVLSERVGRTSGETEQYATFYRPYLVTILSSDRYVDPDDVFTRDPFLTEIQFKNSDLGRIVLVNLHAKPDSGPKKETVKEISELRDVYDFIRRKYDTTNVVIAGDFNAAGSYVRKGDWKDVEVRHDPQFNWLVPDDMDTTVGVADRAYDRIIVAGDDLNGAIVPESVAVFRFDEHLPGSGGDRMTLDEAKKVSDHYPVEFKIQVR